MKLAALIIMLVMPGWALFAQTVPPIQWNKALGGSNSEYDGNREPILKVAPTSDKGYIIAATSYSSDGDVSGNNGKHDAWIVKLNQKGAVQWEKNFGGNDWDWVNSIQQTSDGGYIVIGVISSTDIPFRDRPGAFDVWVMKLSSQGDLEWQKFYGGTSYDYGQAILQTDDGGYIFCGRTQSTNGNVSGNHGMSDIWVVKLDNTGNITWQKCYGGVYAEFGNSIEKTSDGGYIIGGWQSQTGSTVVYDNDMQAYAIKIDASGNVQWEKKYGGSHYEDINMIRQTSDGGYIFTGVSCSNDGDVSGNHFGSFGYHDAWVVKLDNSGNLIWQKCIGGNVPDKGFDVAEVADGYYVVGQAQSNDGDITGNHGLIDGLVAKLSLQGQLQNVKMLGGSSTDFFRSLIVEQTQGNTELVIGGLAGSFDGDVTGYHNNGDVWILKLSNMPFQYNTISGGAFLDQNANGLHDFGEPAYDNKYVYIKDNLGFYSKYKNKYPAMFSVEVDTGRYETDLHLADTSSYRSVPRTRTSVFSAYGQTDNFEFALVRKDLLSNAFVGMGATSAARPSQPVSYSGSFYFEGTRSQIDGIIKIVKDPRLSYVSASLTTEFITGDTIGLRFSNLAEGDIQGFTINFQLADVPLAQPGDSLLLYYNIMPLTVDAAYFNDWDTLKQVISPKVNFIVGEAFLDINGNNNRDNDEPAFTDGTVISQKGATTVASGLGGAGFYNEVDTGAYTTRLVPFNPYYTVMPAQHNSNFSTYYNRDSFGFAVTPIPGIKDLEINIFPVGKPKPGFQLMHGILFKNAGTEIMSDISVRYVKDPRTTLVSATPTPTSINGDTLTWNYSTLDPLDDDAIIVELSVATPPAVNQGDTLSFSAAILPVAGDNTTLNNTFQLKQIAVNSFDPNDKTESHAGRAPMSRLQMGDRLYYIVRFQNTGNDVADNVIVKDTLDARLDWSSLQMMSASHSCHLRIQDGNKLTWTFNNILLPGSAVDEPGSHGYIAYSIKAKPDVAAGDTVKNRAFIYFDFNAPISTNTEKTVVEGLLTALPMRLVLFNAVPGSQVVNLSWKTGFEADASHFEIERSADGSRFETLGKVKANNRQGGSNYAYIDAKPFKGLNYYRLRLVNADGSHAYSDVVKVKFASLAEVIVSLTPNPSVGRVWLKLDGPVNGKVVIKVSDLQGKQLMVKDMGNQNALYLNIPLNTQGLGKGVYIISTNISGKDHTTRLVLQ